MFRCQVCGQVAPAGTRAHKVTVVSRARVYSARGGNQEGGRRNFRAPRKPFDKGGKGTEIVSEVTACESCAKKQTHQVVAAPEVVEETMPTEVTETADVAETAAATTEPAAVAPAADAKPEAAE